LDAALELGFPCGGWCPAGRLAEDGQIPKRYPVVELANGGYAERTSQHVADSDGTLIIAHGPLTGGTRETLQVSIEQGKPHLVIAHATVSAGSATDLIERFVRDDRIKVLNVAGPRASQWPRAHAVAQQIVSSLLRRISGHNRADEYSA
jgi:hypothetical protein